MTGFLPYARQVIEDDDVEAVEKVLRGDWLTTGPNVEAFDEALAKAVGARHAVVCNSGTAALYIASRAAGLKPGDKVISLPSPFSPPPAPTSWPGLRWCSRTWIPKPA